MINKFCLAIFLVGIFLNPSWARSENQAVFDQFVDAFNVGLFQGVLINSELILESDNDVNNTQGVNIIFGYYFDGRVVQKAIIEDNLSLSLSNGDNAVQGVNIYRGAADEISQVAIINGTTTMTSANNTNGIQGINIITNCETCN